jgi:trehalose-6-phosphate synthase
MDEDERVRRAQAMREHIRVNDLAAWLEALLADVEQVSRNVRP